MIELRPIPSAADARHPGAMRRVLDVSNRCAVDGGSYVGAFEIQLQVMPRLRRKRLLAGAQCSCGRLIFRTHQFPMSVLCHFQNVGGREGGFVVLEHVGIIDAQAADKELPG